MPVSLRFLSCAAVALAVMLAMTPAASAQQRSLVRVLHADSLVTRGSEATTTRELLGNVRMEQDNVQIRCDRATQFLDENTAQLEGNVVITQDTLVLRTRRGRYDGNTKSASTVDGIYLFDGHVTVEADRGRYDTGARVATFASRVRVRDSAATITAGGLRYERDSARAIAWDAVRVDFPADRATITGDSVIHHLRTRISLFPSRPLFWQIDSTRVRGDSLTGASDSLRLDTLHLAARRMEAHRDSTNRFLADGNVAIVRSSLAARAGHAAFLRGDSLAILRGSPIAWYEDTQLTGDSIALALADGRVRYVDVEGAAFSIARSFPSDADSVSPPGRFDQTSGRRIRIEFRDDSPERVDVRETAISLYWLYDDRALNGVRRESGDRIIIEFEGGRAETIRVLGGVEGVYHPEQDVTGRETTFHLDGFNWREDRPVLTPLPPAPSP